MLLVIGAFSGWMRLEQPLLEGAAGKQTHTAMVARNLHRDRATFTRPRVDDVGQPGYFIKELPVLAAGAATAYDLSGAVDERWLRLLATAAWLLALPAFAGLVRGALGLRAALVAGLWMVASPMATTYVPSAMTDPLAVAASIGTLASVVAWQRAPGLVRAMLCALLVTAAALLKPHAVFWLGPAAVWLVFRGGSRAPTVPRAAVAALAAFTAVGIAAATAWYLHAASVHQAYPVPGATVADGWTDASLLHRPALYTEIGRQATMMVFTPLGLALALLGLVRGPRLDPVERAFLLWGAGVLVQCLVFAPRMFDGLSRGTEYYQLPLVPTAAVLIGRGLEVLSAWPARGRRGNVIMAAALVLLLVGAVREASIAASIPKRYENLLSDCDKVRAVTAASDRFVVFADRGGTVLYYCDRSGIVFSRAREELDDAPSGNAAVAPIDVSRAMDDANFVYFPFAQENDEEGGLPTQLAEMWSEVPLPDSGARLFANPKKTRRGSGR